MVEAYLPIDEQVKYYEVSDFPFNFKLIGMRPAHLRPLSAQTVLNQIHKWIDNTPKGKLSNWVVRKCIKCDSILVFCHTLIQS